MEKVKVYLDETRNATIVCPNCGKSREINFSQREAPPSSLVKCGCGNSFIVLFEKRQYYRKQVDIRGIAFAKADLTEGEPIQIMDVSIGGVHFRVSGINPFHLDQKLRIVFRLEDKTVSMVVSVRRIIDNKVGAEITTIDDHSRKVLGFFLRP